MRIAVGLVKISMATSQKQSRAIQLARYPRNMLVTAVVYFNVKVYHFPGGTETNQFPERYVNRCAGRLRNRSIQRDSDVGPTVTDGELGRIS